MHLKNLYVSLKAFKVGLLPSGEVLTQKEASAPNGTLVISGNSRKPGVVTMQINGDVKFPTDSSAKILTAGLLGDQYIGLEPGGDEKNLVSGDVITQTQSAMVLENLIGQFLFNKAADSGTANSN